MKKKANLQEVEATLNHLDQEVTNIMLSDERKLKRKAKPLRSAKLN